MWTKTQITSRQLRFSGVALGALLVALSAVVGAASQGADLQPIDPQLLRGAGLYSDELNVSLQSPGSGWEWLASTQETGRGANRFRLFACRLSGTPSQFLVAVFNPYWDDLTPETAARLTAGVVHGLKKHSWTITQERTEPSEVPLPGSYRFQLSAVGPSGETGSIYGYVATRGRLFTFQHYSAESSEPPLFTSFVRSFRFVGLVPRDPLATIGQFHMFVALAVTFLLGGVGWAINRAAGRVAINLWKAAIPLLVLGAVAFAILWFRAMPEGVSSERWGYVLGSVIIGPVLLPLILAVWRSNALARRRARETAQREPQG